MIQNKEKMGAMQLTTDEGAFVCNMMESDIPKVVAKEPGIHVVIYCAIRLDAMSGGRMSCTRQGRLRQARSTPISPLVRKREHLAPGKELEMNKRILFVDSDPTVAGAVNDMLEQMGHRVQFEISGTDALPPLKETPGDLTSLLPNWECLISPGSFWYKRSEDMPRIPVILLASQEGKTQSIARESGIRWFAIKPLSLTEISSTVDAAMNGLAN